MSNNTNLSKLANVLDDGSSGQFLKSTGSGGVVFDAVAAGMTVYAGMEGTDGTPSGAKYLLNVTSPQEGDQAFVSSTNSIFVRSSSGWRKVATVQESPGAITGASSSYDVTTTTTDITLSSTDPEGFDVTWSYAVGGGGTLSGSNIVDSNNVTLSTISVQTAAANSGGVNTITYRITPVTTSVNGSYTITFNATDTQSTGAAQTGAIGFTVAFIEPFTITNMSDDGSSYRYGPQLSLNQNVTAWHLSDDGTKMILAKRSSMTIYTLSTAFNFTTAGSAYTKNLSNSNYLPYANSLWVNSAGTALYHYSDVSGQIHKRTMNSSYNLGGLTLSSDYLNPSSQFTTDAKILLWNNDGTKLWVGTHGPSYTHEFYEYENTSANAYTLATLSYNKKISPPSNNGWSFTSYTALWNNDGTKIVLGDYYLRQYSVSSAYDLGSTITYENDYYNLADDRLTSTSTQINCQFNQSAISYSGNNFDAGRKLFALWPGHNGGSGSTNNYALIYRYSVG